MLPHVSKMMHPASKYVALNHLSIQPPIFLCLKLSFLVIASIPPSKQLDQLITSNAKPICNATETYNIARNSAIYSNGSVKIQNQQRNYTC